MAKHHQSATEPLAHHQRTTHSPDDPIEGREVTKLEAEASVVTLLDKGQLDVALTTAHRFPRSVKAFRDEVTALAMLNEETARECFYTLERRDKDGKNVLIIGPSARFAEIIGSAWRNARAGARVVDDRGGFVVAQGVFFDLEKNWTVTYEVQRRITTKSGYRYSEDMIGVTANAACAIAIRNAVLKGVPKALWADLWEQTREVALGKGRTHEDRRNRVFQKLGERGVTAEVALKRLGRKGLEDVTPDDLLIIFGLMEKVKDGEQTISEAFSPKDEEESGTNAPAINELNERARSADAEITAPGAGGTASATAPAQPGAVGPSEIEVAAKINQAKTPEALDEQRAVASSMGEPSKTRLLDLANARALQLGLK